jgi:hypothetical protein
VAMGSFEKFLPREKEALVEIYKQVPAEEGA